MSKQPGASRGLSPVLSNIKRAAASGFLAATAALSLLALPAEAQSYTVLHAFELPPAPRYANLVQGTDGNFYGTTYVGGAFGYGTVFRITPAGSLTTVHSFMGSDGQNPYAGLVQGSDGNFYGTTYQGGASKKEIFVFSDTFYGYGTVFKITPTGTLTTLHSFSGSDGGYPYGGLVQGGDGNFYGTTYQGGTNYIGTVFKITASGTLTTLHSFTYSEPGSLYAGLVQGSDGNFYGTSSSAAFKITPTGTLTTFCSFSRSDGDPSRAGLVQASDGNFYGTTYQGGTSSRGTVFKITPTGTLTTLYSFMGSDGQYPYAGLVQGSDGNFYGTTSGVDTEGWGPPDPGSNGTVFKITPTGTLTTLHSFLGIDGQYPYAGLVQGGDGNLYGTTSPFMNLNYGSPSTGGYGTIFKITPAGGVTTLHSFSLSDGYSPTIGLNQGSDGNFYGTTPSGGASDQGTVFKISPMGALTTLYSFSGSDGKYPWAGVVQGADGNFYGTTSGGGANGQGTVFKISPTGTLTTLYSFSGSDGDPARAGLIQGSDGNFYGTTSGGGAGGYGTVFKITPTGTLTTLYSFSRSDGWGPLAGLAQGADGDYYGTTSGGGPLGYGTVFKITSTGTLTTLYSFSGIDGEDPTASLVQGSDGNFYGTTYYGGAGFRSSGSIFGNPDRFGTVFRITPTGALTTLYSFTESDGWFPTAGLVQGSDGNLYGTTVYGGLGPGTIFKITPAGTLTTLHWFSESSGEYADGLVQGVDGNLYGTAGGGPLGGGVVYRLTLGPGPAPTVTGVSPSGGPSTGGTVVTVSGTDFQPDATVGFGETSASSVTFIDAMTIWAVTPAHATGAVTVGVWNPGPRMGSLSSAFTYSCTSNLRAVASGTAVICAGQSTQLTGSGGVSCSWSPSTGLSSASSCSPTASPSVTTTYTLTVTDGPGCVSVNAPTVTVTVGTVPAGPVVSTLSTVGAGSQNLIAIVLNDAGSTYKWAIQNGTITSGQGTSQIRFTAGTGGTLLLSVVEITSLGCSSPPWEAYILVVNQPLVLSQGRVGVSVDWQNPYSGESGKAYAIWQAEQFGFFYYSDPNNPEVFVKVLDFGAGSALCFVGGLTDFYYKVTFTMLRTGQMIVFEKPAYQYIGFVDNSTLKFAGTPGMTFVGALATGEPTASSTMSETRNVLTPTALAAAPQSLELSAGRISVTVDWRNPYSGETGRAYGIPKADQYGFFYYADASNPEVFVKVLDFGSGSALVFVGGLTDFYYKVTFTVIRTGQTLIFEKPEYQYLGFVDNSTLKF
ncbi:MAG: choice-of-anchor tandem repeat GloVer-containing protein [Thermoanaerobaculia bacterium]